MSRKFREWKKESKKQMTKKKIRDITLWDIDYINLDEEMEVITDDR